MKHLSTSTRHMLIAGSVVLFHVGAVWALQTGLLIRVLESVVPVQLLTEFIETPRPKLEPPPKPLMQSVRRKIAALPPPPMPIAIADNTPSTDAPTGAVAQPASLPAIAALVVTVANPGPAALVPRVELPSSDADYLENPKPVYPTRSRRLGEQGRVIVRVLIGVDGLAQQVEIRKSSGYDRLDQSALTAVQNWRYVPGKRGGVPEAMWFNVPINYVSE